MTKERLNELYKNTVFTEDEIKDDWKKCECGTIHNSILCICMFDGDYPTAYSSHSDPIY